MLSIYCLAAVLSLTTATFHPSLRQFPTTGLDSRPDPSCSRGKRAGAACCPSGCPACGGPTCYRTSLRGQCCSGAVISSGRGCQSVGPPCKLGATGGSGTPKTPTNPGSGKAVWKNIDSSITGRPRKRHEACFVMLNGKGYLLGGRGWNGFGLDIFDPKARRWTQGARLPTQMHHMQCCTYQGSIYVASSWFGSYPREKNNDRMWIYNTWSNKWSSRPGLPSHRRRGAAACVVHQDKLYVVAGNRGGHGPGSVTLGMMDAYDLRAKRWITNLPNLPSPRDHVGGAIVNGQLCIAGGRNGAAAGFFSKVIQSTYCYNFTTRKWRNMNADIPAGRAGANYGRTCDGKMMIAGGEGAMTTAFKRVDVFDGRRWQTLAELQRGRHGTGLAVASSCSCGQVFVTSGSGNRGGSPELTSTEVYLPNGKDVRCSSY